MRLSRRGVLSAALVAAGGAGSWCLWRAVGFTRSAGVRSAVTLPDAEPAALSAGDAGTLVAAAAAVIGVPIEPVHYAEYYRWRAGHLRGYHALYRAFVRDVDRRARASAGRAFADSPVVVRRGVLEPARRARAPRSLSDHLRSNFDGGAWQLYDRYILAEGLALFARTDAWTALGYRGWPGEARGLDRYQQAPA